MSRPPRLAFLFPGTGTQHVGMAADIVAEHPLARAVFDRASRILGWDVAALCFEGPPERLERTLHAQPAIFAVSMACLEVLAAKGVAPSAVAGHSLGEWAALVAAGVLSFEDALQAVQRRAELMETVGAAAPGAMAAIIGAPSALVEEVCRSLRAEGVIDVVIRNAHDQLVISGTVDLVDRAQRELASASTCIPLDTTNAFHTTLVAPVAAGLASVLAQLTFRAPRVPFCSNWSGEFMANPEEIRRSLVAQVTGPIDWVAVCSRLLNGRYGPFVEVGPRRVLSGLLRRLDPRVACLSTATLIRMNGTLATLVPLVEQQSAA